MPSLVKEITQGDTKTKERSGQQAGSGTAVRVFRVVLTAPNEQFDEQATCGVNVGSPHPTESGYICISFTRSYEGESRMVVNVTFNYQFATQQDRDDQPPDSRPANWSISSSLYEKPCLFWQKRIERQNGTAYSVPTPAVNVAGDMYDGVVEMGALVTIGINQWVQNDPTQNARYVGSINEEQIIVGSLVMAPHTVMLRGIQATPTVETYQGGTYRGWIAAYEFAYKENKTFICRGTGNDADDAEQVQVALGWDIAVPITGFNCRAFEPQNARNDQDKWGQPLRHGDRGSEFWGKVDTSNFQLPEGVSAGDKVRSMIKVFSYEGGGASQTPSAMPIALNRDGTPRLISADIISENSVRPLVYGYSVNNVVNFTETLKLRLES